MSIGSLGFMSGIASLPQAQAGAADAQRNVQDATAQGRAAQSSEKAEAAAGVGRTEEEQQAGDRDADGRRLWEIAQKKNPSEAVTEGTSAPLASKDATGDCGKNLDLSG